MEAIDKVIFYFFLSLPVYIVGAYVVSNWLTDILYVRYRILIIKQGEHNDTTTNRWNNLCKWYQNRN